LYQLLSNTELLNTLVAVGLIFSIVGTLYVAGSSFRNALNARRLPREPEYVRVFQGSLPPSNPQLDHLHWTLHQLDFHLLGMLQIKMPRDKRLKYEWIYGAPVPFVYAEVVTFHPNFSSFVQFSTRFPDDALIVTRYPMGENIDTPFFHSHYADQRVDYAWAYHVDLVNREKAMHGEPLSVNRFDDALEHDKLYARLYALRDQSRLVRANLVAAIFTLIGGSGLISLLAAYAIARDHFFYVFAYMLIVSVAGVIGLTQAIKCLQPSGAIDQQVINSTRMAAPPSYMYGEGEEFDERDTESPKLP
jgi:hypothetical protein